MGTLQLGSATTDGTLLGEIAAGLGNRSDISNARLTTAVNLTQEQIARLHDFEELQTTQATTVTYTGDPAQDLYLAMPDSSPYIREIYSVLLKDGSNSRKLRRYPTRTWDTLLGDPTVDSAGDGPRYYTIWDYSLAKAEMYPLPRKDYTIQWRLSRWPTPFTGSDPTAKSDFRFKDELIIEGAIIYLMFSLGMEDDAAKHARKFSALWQGAINTDTDKPDLEIHPNPGRSGAGDFVGDYHLNPFIKSMRDIGG